MNPDGQEVELDTFLEHADARFGQPVALGIQERASKPSQTWSAPKRQRRPAAPRAASGKWPAACAARARPSSLSRYLQIQGAGRQGQQVAAIGPGQQARRRAGLPIRLERTAQPGNVPLDQVHGVLGRFLAPYRIVSAVGSPSACLQGQDRQDHSLLQRAQDRRPSRLARPEAGRARRFAAQGRPGQSYTLPAAQRAPTNLTPERPAFDTSFLTVTSHD